VQRLVRQRQQPPGVEIAAVQLDRPPQGRLGPGHLAPVQQGAPHVAEAAAIRADRRHRLLQRGRGAARVALLHPQARRQPPGLGITRLPGGRARRLDGHGGAELGLGRRELPARQQAAAEQEVGPGRRPPVAVARQGPPRLDLGGGGPPRGRQRLGQGQAQLGAALVEGQRQPQLLDLPRSVAAQPGQARLDVVDDRARRAEAVHPVRARGAGRDLARGGSVGCSGEGRQGEAGDEPG
jgi:hypothetical protein